MPKGLWFLLGFLFALALGGLLIVAPMAGIGAGPAPTPAAAPPSAGGRPAAQPTPAWQPTTPPSQAGLRWVRQGPPEPPLASCSQLVVDAAWQIRYGPCDQALRLAYLSEGELAWYQAYMLTLAPFDYVGPSAVLTFVGQGERHASPREQTALAAWAEGVYVRAMGEEQRANLLAQARLDLMARRGIGLEAIRVAEMEPVRWPDACLGLRQPGVDCARVSAAGYRIVLVVEGASYEYRADVYGQVRAVAGRPAHLTLPPRAP